MNISEGCSACACGVAGACDELILPDNFGWIVFFIVLSTVAIASLVVSIIALQRMRKQSGAGRGLIIGLRVGVIMLTGTLIVGSIMFFSLHPIRTTGQQVLDDTKGCIGHMTIDTHVACEY